MSIVSSLLPRCLLFLEIFIIRKKQNVASESLSPKRFIYVELLPGKANAPEAILKMMAQVRGTVGDTRRVHTDRGGEFLNFTLQRHLREHLVYQTSTQGYDSNANWLAGAFIGIVSSTLVNCCWMPGCPLCGGEWLA